MEAKQFKTELDQVNKNYGISILDYVHLFLIKQFPNDYKGIGSQEERNNVISSFDNLHQQLEVLDYTISLNDIILDLNKEVVKGEIFIYYERLTDTFVKYINYNSWLMGYKPSEINPLNNVGDKNNQSFKVTYADLINYLKEAYKSGFSNYEMVEAGLSTYDAEGYVRWALIGIKNLDKNIN